MGLNVDDNLKKAGYKISDENSGLSSGVQKQHETKPSQPIDMTGETQPVDESGAKQPIEDSSVEESATAGIKGLSVERTSEEEEKVTYTIKKGDTLWAVAKQQLINSGNPKPSTLDILKSMKAIATANGCKNPEDCRKKYFNHIGSQLDLTGLFGTKEKKSKQVQQDAPSETQSKPAGSVSETELGKLAEQTGVKGNLDEIVAELKAKELKGENLTSTQEKFLKEYDTYAAKTPVFQDEQEIRERQQMLNMMNKLSNKEFSSLPPEEKLKTLAKTFIAKNDSKYNSLNSEEEKNEYLNNVVKDLEQLAKPKDADTGLKALFADNITIIRSVVLLQYCEQNKVEISELKKNGSDALQNIITRGENKAIDIAVKLIKEEVGDKLKNAKSSEEQLNIYSDAILSKFNKVYAAMPEGKEKEEFKQKQIEEFVTKLLKDKGIPNLDEKLKDKRFLKEVSTTISYSLEYVTDTTIEGSFIDKLKKINFDTPEAKAETIINMLAKKTNLTAEDKLLKARAESFIKMLNLYRSKGGEGEPTIEEALEIYKQMQTEAKSSKKTSKEQIEAIDTQVKFYNKMKKLGRGEKNCKFIYSLTEKANASGKELKKYYKETLSDLKPHSEDYERYIKEIVNDEVTTKKDISKLVELLIEDGYTKEQAEALTCGSLRSDAAARIMAYTSEGHAYIHDNLKNNKDKEVQELLLLSARITPTKEFGYNEEELTIVGSAIANDVRLHKSFQESLVANQERNVVSSVITGINNSGKVSDADISQFNKTFISETLSNDSDRLYYGKTLSQNTSNAAALEGLAAASNSIQDQNIKSQYNSHIETAAEKLPPEQQQTVKTALQTGEISKETQAKTSIPAESKSAAKDESSARQTVSTQTDQKSAKTKASAPTSQSSQQKSTATTNPAKATTTPNRTVAPGNIAGSSSRQTILNGGNSSRSTSSNSVASTENSTNKASSTNNSTSTGSTSKTGTNPAVSVSESEKLKADAMAYAKEVADEIKTEVEIWQKSHPQVTEDDIETIAFASAVKAAADAVESKATDKATKFELLERISKTTSVDEIYEILLSKNIEISSIKTKVLDVLAGSATSSNVRRIVLEVIDDDTTVKELYKRTTSSSVKKELLNIMSTDSIIDLLKNKTINNYNEVDHNILTTFLHKNMSSMSESEFRKYMEYFDTLEQRAFMAEYYSKMGIVLTKEQDAPTQEVAQNVAQPASVDPQQKNPQQNQHKGDMTRVLADGTEQTRQGTGFGTVSDNEPDGMYRNVKPDAPIGMDEVLTPGSAGWNRKYNKNNVPPPPFTMAALKPDEDDDGLFGKPSPTIPNWKIRNKKGFNFKG